MNLLAIAVAVLAGLALGGPAFFTAATYLLASRHQAARPLSRSLVEALREFAWSVVLVVILPSLYVFGRRLGKGSGRVPVVFVHGYTQNRSNFLRMARIVGRGAAGPMYGFNYNWLLTVEPCARSLDRFVDRVLAETGARQVDLVCHSLGGLVARAMLAGGGAAKVRSVATIGSPHAGVTWRVPLLGGCGPQMKVESPFLGALSRPLPVPFLSLYSTHDNIVHPPKTSSLEALGGADHVVEGGHGHLSLLFVPEVAELVRRFLESQPQPAQVPAAAEGQGRRTG
ncbi:MAG TPA: alpha/beta fold hydrolase [Myxococcales bacterium]|jgi:predicted alpha/beta hydrolase family esterase